MHSPDGTAGTSQRSHFTGMSRETQDTLDDIIDSGNWHGIINAVNNVRSRRISNHSNDDAKHSSNRGRSIDPRGRSIGSISIGPSPDGSDDIVKTSPGLAKAIDADRWR